MKLEDGISSIENIKDINVAKAILELESNPNGYYEKIYNEVIDGLNNNISEKKLKKIFDEFERNQAIKHFQYISSIYDEIKDTKLQTLLRKTTFLNAISSISDIQTLKLYLILLNQNLKNKDISYNNYVPKYKII